MKNKLHLTVEFEEGFELTQIVGKVGDLTSPHVILWYIGSYGLKKHAVEFYRDSLIFPIFHLNVKATFWLIDLTAWGALKDSKVSLSQFSSHAIKLDSFISERVKCIKSADIFKKMQSISEPKLIEHFQMALSKNFIWQASTSMRPSKLHIGSLFMNRCPLLSKFYDRDANKSYSMLQYLEGCLLVEEIVRKVTSEKEQKDIQIVFILPNDEIKYYQDDVHSFQRDLETLLENSHKNFTNELNVTVKFLSFKYGDCLHYRPYNAPGKVLRKNELTPELVLGHKLNQQDKDHVASAAHF